MSDEPLYCPACGDEIGPDHRTSCTFHPDLWSGDVSELVYCEICGGKEPCGCEYSSRV
jgi:hypothetical protein